MSIFNIAILLYVDSFVYFGKFSIPAIRVSNQSDTV